ncbi:MAG: hypothetical protein L3J74_16475 [Bacteroidales bacterium]|nr:hypothetical protein [Bacteroidales bacterium]
MNELMHYKNILLIGGATRNVGKTTFTCSIIENISKKHLITGLKIKTIYAGDDFFHGKERNPLTENYQIIEEKNAAANEDTERMLKAGAHRVFRIKAKNDFLNDAFNDFYSQIPKNSLIICESNSLRNILKPAFFLLIKHKNSGDMKPSAQKLAPLADKIIYSDGIKHDFDIQRIGVRDNEWVMM